MTIGEYVKKRNGVPFGDPRSLKYNIRRSLGAKNFATFWNFWNPIFGYYLGKYIFKPLTQLIHSSLALMLTFVISGAIHDLFTTLIRGKLSIFFCIWFFFMSLAVVLSKSLNYDLSRSSWISRAISNLSIVIFCALITIILNKIVLS
ncbi:MBOAT family O-acyltransferase [Sphingobacterium bambusae]|uniref:MBOAT family O-acyltransferase n=1 Tax=Sphingobacterium bambusae TaxID=662858 RepID=A0ABW6BH22_9SPHI